MRKKIKLGEIIDTIQGSQYSLDEQITENKEGYLRFLRISDYTKADEPIRYVKYTGKELVCKEDEVVVVRYGNVGFIGYGKKGILANNLFVLRLKNKSFDSKYLYYYLNSPNINSAIVNKANSSTMPALTHKMIKELEIPVVDIEEQKSIVSRLNKIQKIIDIRKEQIEYLDELIKSQFVEMFKNIEKKEKLGDLCYIKARIGWQALTKKEYLNTGDYYLVTGVDIDTDRDRIDFEKCSYVSKERYEMDENIQLFNGDVIITKDGTIGKVALIENLDKPATLNSHLFVLRDKSGLLNNIYLLNLLKSENFKDFISRNHTGTTRMGLNQSNMVNYLIPIPDIDLQNKFAEFVKQVDKQKFEIQKSLEKMQNLYESIMDNYFGE